MRASNKLTMLNQGVQCKPSAVATLLWSSAWRKRFRSGRPRLPHHRCAEILPLSLRPARPARSCAARRKMSYPNKNRGRARRLRRSLLRIRSSPDIPQHSSLAADKCSCYVLSMTSVLPTKRLGKRLQPCRLMIRIRGNAVAMSREVGKRRKNHGLQNATVTL